MLHEQYVWKHGRVDTEMVERNSITGTREGPIPVDEFISQHNTGQRLRTGLSFLEKQEWRAESDY